MASGACLVKPEGGDLLCWVTRALLTLPVVNSHLHPPEVALTSRSRMAESPRQQLARSSSARLGRWIRGHGAADTVALLHSPCSLALPLPDRRRLPLQAGAVRPTAPHRAPMLLTLIRICKSSRSLPSHLSKGSRSCRRWLVGLTSTRCPLLSLGGCW